MQNFFGRKYACVVTRFLLGVCILFASFHSVADETAVNKEYQIKAAYLYNILKFVDWPENKIQLPLMLCVYGKNPFGELLKPLESRTVAGRSIRISYIVNTPASTCDVVFIGKSSNEQIIKLITVLGGKGVLTVGEQPGFLDAGGIVEFVEKNNTIRFNVNMTRAQKIGLPINSQLTDTALEVR